MSVKLRKQYEEQFKAFAKIDDFTIEQVARKLPEEKHFWVARLADAKRSRNELLVQRKKLKQSIMAKMIKDSPVAINKVSLDKSLENSPHFEELDESLREMDNLIEYLENVVKIVMFMAQDIKNILTLKELERL